jgi:hypothetical protein
MLRGVGEVLIPHRHRLLDPANQPRDPVWCAGIEAQRPIHFLRSAITLEVVARKTARHEVLPRIFAAARSRQNVIDGVRRATAVRAPVIVATKHTTARHGNAAAVGESHVATKDDDRWPRPFARRPEHRILVVFGDHRRLFIEHKHNRTLERHDAERLVARVEYQSSHCCPFRTGLHGLQALDLVESRRGQKMMGKQKGTVTTTVPRFCARL